MTIVTVYNPQGEVLDQYEVPEPEPTLEEAARASAVAKLQALGLTEAEALALVAG